MSPPSSLPRAVLRTLAAVRRRRRALAVLQAVCWTLAALAVGGFALLLAPDEGPAPTWARIAGRIWAGGAVLVPFALFVVPTWRRTRSWLAVARAVDDRVPATGDQLLTAVDLARALDARTLPDDPETERLARAQLEASSFAAGTVFPEEILPVTGLHGSSLGGPILSGILLCAWLLGPVPFERGIEAIFGPVPVADAEPTTADSAELPVTLTLRNLTITLTPPAYSGREPLLLEGTTGDFQALPGTRVHLEADADAGGKGASVIVAEQDEPTVGALDGRRITVDFVTGNGQEYRVEISRGLGREPLRSRTFAIERLPDHPPELEVLAPGGQLTLTGDDTVPLQVRADDDFALSRLERVVMKGSKELLRTPIADVRGKPGHEELLRWSAAELKGEGGELAIVVEAWDNDTVNGPKVTRSRPVEVYVPTARDQHRKVLALKEELRTLGLDLLADLLVTNSKGTSLDQRDPILAAHDRQQVLANAFFKTADALLVGMASDQLEKGQTYAGILQMVSNFDSRWSGVVELVETQFRDHRHARVHRVTVADLVKARDEAITELEQIVLDLDAFIDLHRGDQIRGDLADLGNQFADMQDLLRRAQDGEMVDEEMAKAMADLEKRMQELARKLAERSPGPNDGFMNQMPNEMSKDAMAEVRELMAQGKYDEAMEKLRKMDEALSGMEQQLDSEMDSMAGAQAQEQLDQELTEAIEQAKELERQQEQVLDQMQDLAERFETSGMSDEDRAKLAEDMAELRKRIDALDAPNDPFVRPSVRRTAWRAGQEAQRMQEAFDEQRMEDAAAYAREAQQLMQDAAQELSADARNNAEARPSRDEARGAARQAGSIAERLEQAQRQQQAQQRQAQKAGQGAGRQQGQVAQGVGQLRQKMDQMGGSAFNPAQGRDNLQNAQELMRKAQGRVGNGDPQRAGSAGRDGLNQLRQFRESMEGAQQALRQGGPPRPGGNQMAGQPGGGRQPNEWDSGQGNAESTAPVEMTDPDEFVGPEAFRELVLEGAQGDAPERYRPLNGTYYEELVR